MIGDSIILADDDDDLRAVYVPFLQSMGWDVREASGGEKAVELIRESPPELLILDVWMPRMNGFTVLEALKRDPIASNLKIMMLSNIGDADTRLECFEMGATDYLVKGLPLAELGERVRSLLREPTEVPPIATPASDPTRPNF